MNRMLCRITDGPRHPDEDAPIVPEITDPGDRDWILDQLSDKWRDHFPDRDTAWECMSELNQPEMDRLCIEVADDNRRAADRGDLCETLADIVRPWLP